MSTALTAPAKVVSYFHNKEGRPGSGWSESIHLGSTTIEDAITATTALIVARLKLAAPDVYWDGSRISGHNQPAQGVFLTFSSIGLSSSQGTYVPTISGPTPQSAPTGVVLMLRVSDDENFHTTMWLGSPVDDVCQVNVYTPDAAFSTAMSGYLTQLNSYGELREQGGSYARIVNIDSITVRGRKVKRAGNPVSARK